MAPIVSKDERIDLTQFEGHGFREVITQNRHEYEEGFPPATVEVNISEGIALHCPLDEKLVSWGGHKVWMSGKDANVIQHFDSLIAELKRCYAMLDAIAYEVAPCSECGGHREEEGLFHDCQNYC